jgi:RNA polymerase sigma-70 factor, ECF subfamily
MSYSLPLTTWVESKTHSTTAPALDQLSIQELVAQCQQGFQPDRLAFGELLRRHQSHVDRLLHHLAPDWQDRLDLSQEVWIRVYRYVHRLQEPAKFRSWLSRITTNLFYDELRRRRRHQKPLSLDAPLNTSDGTLDWDLEGHEPGPADTLATQEFYEHLQEGIRDLPEVFRSTIVLREIEGLAYEEIAQMQNISVGTVKSRIARARRRLQEHLAPFLS